MNRVVEYFFDKDEVEELFPYYKRLIIVYVVGIILIVISIFL